MILQKKITISNNINNTSFIFSGLILKNENVIVYKSYQKSFSIFLLLYSSFYENEINISTIIGYVLIIIDYT